MTCESMVRPPPWETENEQSKDGGCRAVVSSLSSGSWLPLRSRRPLRRVGAARSATRRLGGLAAVCCVRRETQLVCPRACHPRPSLGSDLGRVLGGLGLAHWVAVAVDCSCGRLAPIVVRRHHDDGARDQGSVGFLRVRSHCWSVSPGGDQRGK